MSITSVTEVPLRSVDIPAGDPLTNRREFVVVTTSVSDDEADVIFASGVPRHNSQHPALWSFCDGVSAERDADQPLVWHVTASYKGISFNEKEKGKTTDGSEMSRKLAEPTQIQIGTVHYTEPVEYDALNYTTPVVNSAGCQFDPLPTRMASYLAITVSRYEYNPSWTVSIGKYLQTVNFDTFWGMKPETLLLYDASGETHYDEQLGVFYWHATYTIHCKPKGWAIELPDRGFYARAYDPNVPNSTDANGVAIKRRILDGNGEPVVIPQKLDGKGGELKKGLPTVFLPFRIYKQSFFADFKFPNLTLKF